MFPSHRKVYYITHLLTFLLFVLHMVSNSVLYYTLPNNKFSGLPPTEVVLQEVVPELIM
jgi:hypothetical protein